MSDLVCRNVRLAGRRTSIKLEAHMWDALYEICDRTGKSVHQVCTEIHAEGGSASFTSRVRVHILSYFRSAERRARAVGMVHGTPPVDDAVGVRLAERASR